MALLVFGLVIAQYVFLGMVLTELSKRLSMESSWLAWIPIVRYVRLGSVADKSVEVKDGKTKHNKLQILITMIISVISSILFVVSVIASIGSFGIAVFTMNSLKDLAASGIFGGMISAALFGSIAAIAHVVLFGFEFAAYNDILTSVRYQYKTAILLVSVLSAVFSPLFFGAAPIVLKAALLVCPVAIYFVLNDKDLKETSNERPAVSQPTTVKYADPSFNSQPVEQPIPVVTPTMEETEQPQEDDVKTDNGDN